MNTNIFNNPRYYIDQIYNITIPQNKRRSFNSKSLVCVWLTKLCFGNCDNCFFRSNMFHDDIPDEKYQFSQEGINKLVNFINASNNSYLLFSGGGEPMIQSRSINQLIRQTNSERIVIVTNGFFGKSYASAERAIDELFESYQSRKDNVTVILRISVDKFHYQAFGYNTIKNIIDVFKNKYRDFPNFQLRIHTIENDSTLKIVADKLGAELIYSDCGAISDNKDVVKIMPAQAELNFNDGYKITVGIAKLFYSNLKVNLNTFNDDIQKAIDAFDRDIVESEYSNPSLLTNCDGSLGLDFWFDYNGNVCTWGNQLTDNLYNVYTDNYQDFVKGIFDNILSYSFIDKGYFYRENIIREINPLAVLRMKGINLRDYASSILLEEDKTKLYYGIRVIKDYLEENVLSEDDISILPTNLVNVINMPIDEINNLYNISDYDIISQYFDNKHLFSHKTDWDILFILIRLGHYKVSSSHLQEAINYYNETFYCNIKSINDIEDSDDVRLYEKFHERFAFMKKEAKSLCLHRNY